MEFRYYVDPKEQDTVETKRGEVILARVRKISLDIESLQSELEHYQKHGLKEVILRIPQSYKIHAEVFKAGNIPRVPPVKSPPSQEPDSLQTHQVENTRAKKTSAGKIRIELKVPQGVLSLKERYRRSSFPKLRKYFLILLLVFLSGGVGFLASKYFNGQETEFFEQEEEMEADPEAELEDIQEEDIGWQEPVKKKSPKKSLAEKMEEKLQQESQKKLAEPRRPSIKRQPKKAKPRSSDQEVRSYESYMEYLKRNVDRERLGEDD